MWGVVVRGWARFALVRGTKGFVALDIMGLLYLELGTRWDSTARRHDTLIH
jgi:hypothetical protein